MYYLESLVGEDAFNDFLRYYIRTNSLTSVTTIKLRANWEYFVATMIPDKSSDDINRILKAVDWDTWVYEPTLAPEPLNFNTPNSDQATQLALGYIALNGTGSPENYTAYLGYYSNLKVIF